MITYYHISLNNRLKVLTPKIPDLITDEEDCKTLRCCFSDNILGCLRAMPTKYISRSVRRKMPLTIYKKMGIERPYIPSFKEVPDSAITREVWTLKKTKIRKVKTIRIKKMSKFNKTRYFAIY